MAQDIYLIKPSICNNEDSYCWLKTRTGIYSVKSGYYALREASPIQQAQPPLQNTFNWQKNVWKERTSPKLKLFLWKLCRGALALGANLQSRGINVHGTCPNCSSLETAMHLFFTCPFARQVWELSPVSIAPDFSTASTVQECFGIMSTLVCLPPTGISSNYTFWVLWGLWTTRNRLIFENRSTSARALVNNASSAARDWLLAQSSLTNKQAQGSFDLELPEFNPEVFCCNTDGAWNTSRRAGLGWCFENVPHGFYSEGSRALDHISSPLMAEALAMREAMQVAKRTSLHNVWFRTDSQELARAVNSKLYSGALWSSHGYRITILFLFFRLLFPLLAANTMGRKTHLRSLLSKIICRLCSKHFL